MYTALNDEDNIKKRLYGNRLVSSGRALIILGVWSSVKAVITLYMTMPYVLQLVTEGEALDGDALKDVSILVWIISAVFMIAVFLIYFYVGRSAMKNGYGEKRTVFFLVIDVLLVIGTVISIIVGVGDGIDVLVLASILIDLTVVFASIDILYSAIRLKTIEKKIEEKE